MKKFLPILLLALLVAPNAFAGWGSFYDGESFPLKGLRFYGYEGTDSKPLYEIGFILCWIIAPIFAMVCMSTWKEAGCFWSLVCLVFVPLWFIFLLRNFDWVLGFYVGPFIFGTATTFRAIGGLFSGKKS